MRFREAMVGENRCTEFKNLAQEQLWSNN